MFTTAEIITYKPPNSPIAAGSYWEDIRVAAERKVKDICRRALESANYTDKAYTLKVEHTDGTVSYVLYLSEPTGSVLSYADFTTLTLDDSTVEDTSVTIEVDRLIFDGAGEIVATYPGGFMRGTATAVPVLRQAVIACMHILHAQAQGAGVTSLPVGGGVQTVRHGDEAFDSVRVMLAPYICHLPHSPYVTEAE